MHTHTHTHLCCTSLHKRHAVTLPASYERWPCVTAFSKAKAAAAQPTSEAPCGRHCTVSTANRPFTEVQ
uniref:Uncharacterized protein n=1 Tax=Anguilla anguilla TaxID=7936 RepID=A0A0E9RRB4_ANGAN